jgi:cytochrome c biogenesis protein CcdA
VAVEAHLPTLGLVTVTALVDSINPCAIGVLILLCSVFLSMRSRRDLLIYGSIYILAIYVTYISAGLGLIYFLNVIPIAVSEYISIFVGGIIIIGGLIEIKDYFWYGQGISLAISPDRAKQIHEMTRKVTLPGVILLGAFVAAVELPCTGGPYLAILLVLSQNFNMMAAIMLVWYNIIYVMPLVVILAMVYMGTKIQDIKRWKMRNRTTMRLGIGILLIFLGWLLILIANGTINLA